MRTHILNQLNNALVNSIPMLMFYSDYRRNKQCRSPIGLGLIIITLSIMISTVIIFYADDSNYFN